MTDPLIDARNFLARAWQINNLREPTRLQYWLINQMQHGPNDLVVLCFRGFGKSWIGTTRGNHCLYRDKERRFLTVSASAHKARENSNYMRGLLGAMPETRHLVPRRDQRQSSTEFDVAGATQAHAASVRSLGITSNSVTGARASDILADDIESEENSATLSMRSRIAKKNRELGAYVLRTEDDFPADAPPKIHHLGTPQLEDSLYWQLEHAGHTVVIIPARYPDEETRKLYINDAGVDRLAWILQEDLEKDPSLAGKPTEPSRFSDQTLQKRHRRAQDHGWALQYMLLPTLAEANRYPLRLPDLIVDDVDIEEAPEKTFWSSANLYTDQRCPGLTNQDWHGPLTEYRGKMMPFQDQVMAIDPSAGGTDELAYVVLKTLNSQVFLLDCGGFQKGDAEDTLVKLAQVSKQFGIRNVVVEQNFGMGIWGSLFRPFLNRINPVCEVESIHVTGRKNPRICSILEPIVATHRLIVSKEAIRRDQQTSQQYGDNALGHQLFYQMAHVIRDDPDCLRWDDRLDALALGVMRFEDALDRDFLLEIQERELDEMEVMIEEWNDRSLLVGGSPEPEPNWMSTW